MLNAPAAEGVLKAPAAEEVLNAPAAEEMLKAPTAEEVLKARHVQPLGVLVDYGGISARRGTKNLISKIHFD
ncbi:hypothetical protein NUU61_001401 [Penicillium alfredii]|uniref:Uncharacterized protein n=1 Tax=Penicillium alfredii TaxID=1506179 RepID=A0A9W9G4D1_9EURO|nr:uncharacterized protein NUU61_001401 [Penicillium alfredii]KAJ5111771.1 hypothetical protein NUU61_001401 [Penicillium alfredii]